MYDLTLLSQQTVSTSTVPECVAEALTQTEIMLGLRALKELTQLKLTHAARLVQ